MHLRLFEDIARPDGRPGFLKGYFVRIHKPKLPKPEIAHCPGGSTDIERIPGRDQHDPKLIAQLLFQVSVALQALFIETK
jgi:hypothetical protein